MEIMIVIAIVAILMTITMRFGSRRIDDLNVQTIKEEFVQTYSTIFSQAMTSNYSAGKRYEKLTLLI
ncbi:TPA: hypothetical protein DEP21_00665 [Patescibacteria group bacterium]|nr:hypothetical protein [Candidatus Gracilibacteria bacterium]